MNKCLIIYGPTVTGKTNLAIDIAKKYNGELISADSRQVYKSLDVGTGKISFDAKVEKYRGYWMVDGVKINGFDLAKPGITFSAADFLKRASTTLFRINAANKLPIVVGGTGFYIKSLLEGIPSIGIKLNSKLRQKLGKLTKDELHQKLLEIDPSRASAMNDSDRVNPRRLIRAIEIGLYNKKQETRNNKKKTSQLANYPTTDYLILCLTAPNDYLYQRADRWLEKRLQKSLVEEVKNLLDQKISSKWLENLGLEYRWITRYVLGKIDYQEATDHLIGDIHSFIRRQKTWFKKFKNINLFDISTSDWRQKLEKRIRLWQV